MSPPSQAVSRLPMRTTTAVIAGLGVGAVFIGLLFRRWLFAPPSKPKRLVEAADVPAEVRNSEPDYLQRPDSARMTRMRATPSMSERGSVRQGSIRQRSNPSMSVPPLEADIYAGLESVQDTMRAMERALSGLELVKNRSDKDRQRCEMLSSVLDRLRVLETDVNRLVVDGGYEGALSEEGGSGWAYASARGAGTLSVLSDDSFMSAMDEFMSVDIDDDGLMKDLGVDKSAMNFLSEGLKEATAGNVQYRKARTEFCQCENETEFAAKVWCLRQAFAEVMSDEHKRLWLSKAGRQLIADILKHSKQDPSQFYQYYDEMQEFFTDDANLDQTMEELSTRGVCQLGFWDIVLDFILLDSFDDLKSPPSAIYSVTKNRFLSQSMKYSTIKTVIWSMLKAKRQRLRNPSGFIAHFYNISEAVSPSITLGFLGTDELVGELCKYFKEQITCLVVDIFSSKRVRYTSVEELAADVWVVLQTRTEMVQTRLSNELVPV